MEICPDMWGERTKPISYLVCLISHGAARFSARETQPGESPGATAGILKKQSQFANV